MHLKVRCKANRMGQVFSNGNEVRNPHLDMEVQSLRAFFVKKVFFQLSAALS